MAIGYSFGKENADSGWFRWLIPSVGDLIFVAFVGALSCTALSVRLLEDAGTGWHIRTGQIILANHAIPQVDPFSSTMAGQRWFAWEWLYDLVAGHLESVAGLNGVTLLTAIVIAATFSGTFFVLRRNGTNFIVSLILVLLAASASTLHFLARPHVFSWLFAVIWFSLLDGATVKNFKFGSARLSRGQLWVMPPLMVLWANLHGGFLIGLILIGIYWIGASWRWLRLKEDRIEDVLDKVRAGKQARQLALVGAGSLAATFVNPYGWRLHDHIYHYLSNRFLMDHIDEFQSPNFHGVAQRCFAILLMLTFLALATNRDTSRRVGTTEILIVLFALYSGLYASRNIPVSAVLLVLVIGPTISTATLQTMRRLSNRDHTEPYSGVSPLFLERMQKVELRRRGHLWCIGATVLAVWIAFHGGTLGPNRLMDAHFSSSRFPVKAVDYVKNRNQAGPILAPDYWGGYLIYRLYPERKVVVDDRHDLYGEEFLKAYLAFVHVEPNWKRFLEDRSVGCIIVPRESAVASILAVTSSWRLVYSDAEADVYTRP